MFTVCVGLVFRSKYVQFPPIIWSLQYSIKVITVEVDPHSDLLHICIVKPKNMRNPRGRQEGSRPYSNYGPNFCWHIDGNEAC